MTDWKERLGVVFSTDNKFQYETETEENKPSDKRKDKQDIRVFLDKKQRNGKKVTIVTNFVLCEEETKELSKRLKTKCGVGGSVKDGEIIIQGDFREKIVEMLKNEGYTKSRIL